jgi:diguanylate cyclase (GGDEF)-like protein
MDLREYLRVLLKSWWIILAFALVGVTASLLFTYARPPVYEAVSTYVVKCTDQSAVPTTQCLAQLITSQQRLFATYCQVIASQLVRDQATSVAGLDPASVPPADYPVNCNVLPDTNVIRLTTQGPVPALVSRLNEAIGMIGMGSVKGLYDIYYLDHLDTVTLGKDPISTGPSQNAILGGVLGAVLGLTLGLMIEYLRSPRERLEAVTIRDPKLSIYNERYFHQRLIEEINRARARRHPISLALMRLVPDEDFYLLPEATRDALMRSAALRLQDKLHDGDLVAYLKRNLFGLLLVETSEADAQDLLTQLNNDLRAQTFRVEDSTVSFTAHTGLVESKNGALSAESMLAKASEALQAAMQASAGTVHVVHTAPQLPAGSTSSSQA